MFRILAAIAALLIITACASDDGLVDRGNVQPFPVGPAGLAGLAVQSAANGEKTDVRMVEKTIRDSWQGPEKKRFICRSATTGTSCAVLSLNLDSAGCRRFHVAVTNKSGTQTRPGTVCQDGEIKWRGKWSSR